VVSRRGPRPGGIGAASDERWRPWFFIALVAAGASLLVFFAALLGACHGDDEDPGPGTIDARTPTPTPTAEQDATATEEPATEETEEETETPETETPGNGGSVTLVCGDILAPLNKQNALPPDCAPDDLVPIPPERTAAGTQYMRIAARDALLELMEAAAQEGVDLYAVSAYRSYEGQVAAYNSNLAACGGDRACADRISAHPGHSEHQLGTTVDVSSPSAGFGLESFVGTEEAAWLEANAWRFGFVVSYPEGKEHITGYAYEPWHIRWIGREEARRVHESGLTLHEYLARNR